MRKIICNILRIVALFASYAAMSEIDTTTIIPNICWGVVGLWAIIISELYLSENN